MRDLFGLVGRAGGRVDTDRVGRGAGGRFLWRRRVLDGTLKGWGFLSSGIYLRPGRVVPWTVLMKTIDGLVASVRRISRAG